MVRPMKLISILFVLITTICLSGVLFAQPPSLPYTETFIYSVGALIPNDNWTETGANTLGIVQVTSGSLSYTGLPTSTGNKVALLNGTSYEDPGFDIVPVGDQTDPSNVYVSFILNVINPGNTTGEYVQHVCTAGTTSINFHSKVFVRQGTGGVLFFNIGLRNGSADIIQWDSTERPVSTPVFIVVSYDFVPGTINDTSRLWVNTPLGASSPPAPLLTATATGADLLVGVGRINLRQPSASTNLSDEVDEMRIGTTWQYVTPTSVSDWAIY